MTMAVADHRWARIERYIADERLPAARIALEALVAEQPANVQGRMLLSSVLLAQGKLREAAAQALAATRHLPADAETICTVAHCLFRIGETVATRDCLRHPGIAVSRDAPALAKLAHVHQLIGQHDEGLALMDRARALGLDEPEFHYFRALQLQFLGRLAETESELRAALAMRPGFGRAALTLARLHRQRDETLLRHIAAHAASASTDNEDGDAFEFARFKALDDLGRSDEAWSALVRGNDLMRARVGHDGATESRHFERVRVICSAAFLRETAAPQDGPVPIFILGMPRSGTTLLERLLGNHPQVASPGELPDFPRQLRYVADTHGSGVLDDTLLDRAADADYALLARRYLEQTQWHAQGRSHYIDKLPANWMLAGFIRKALPHAVILHMRRSAMEVCYSNYKAMFGASHTYSYRLDELAAHYRDYQACMGQWQRLMPGVILDVSYEALVDDSEAVLRRVLAHCGLPYDARCIDPAGNSNPVSTLSSAQVREPIHRRALSEWRRYQAQLAPLAQALGEG
ncbi:MAG: sulfotransferase [Xanthomonadaceae bacterium]|nr:sulfotransferase [Xanthomonadaceae bacterium]